MSKNFKNCQSCGMPLKKDEKGGGTNADNSKSLMFCSHCYQEGQFTQPEIKASEMKEVVKNKLKEIGFPGFLASFFASGIPRLKRWKKN